LRNEFGEKVGESMDIDLYSANIYVYSVVHLSCCSFTVPKILACTKWQRKNPKDTRVGEQRTETFQSCVAAVVF
jgi:hypothetical protein